MTTLSDPTLSLLVRIGARFGKSDLRDMLMHADVWQYGVRTTGEENRRELTRSCLLGARAEADGGDVSAQRALRAVVVELVTYSVRNPEDSPPTWFSELREKLRGDGFELSWTMEDDPLDPWHSRKMALYELLPADPAPVPLAPEITALEAELSARGYATVLKRYRDAADSLLHHKYESANADVRAVAEDLVTRLAEDHADYQRRTGPTPGQPAANQGWTAITHLVQGEHLPEREGGRLLLGVWDMLHTNGSHPGQSDAYEARFRMQLVTATARFLLRHFPPASGTS